MAGLLNLAVIGAGGAGLAVARHSLAQSNKFTTTIFEQNSRLGGTWIYSSTPNNSSSMYKNLRTNLPKEVMNYFDYPFPSQYESFMSHVQVLKYLNDYATHFNIIPNIRFSCRVLNVKPSKTCNWEIQIEEGGQTSTLKFDAIAVCSGHFSEPRFPNIPDLEIFKGIVLHSQAYREPKKLAGLRVICLGAGPSGIDISEDIAKVASIVYLSHNKQTRVTNPSQNVIDIPGIKNATPTGLNLNNGRHIECDAVLFCTGYRYSFSFLSPECEVTVTDDYVFPLYKQIVHAYKQSLAFIGLQFRVCPFPLFDLQAQFFLKSLLNEINIPLPDQVKSENLLHFDTLREKGKSLRFTHCLDDLQWDYYDDLAKEIGCPLPKPVLKKIYNQNHENRHHGSICDYRKINFVIIDENTFQQVD